MTSKEKVPGCYDPAFEHDACGVAFVADLARPASHRVVDLGLTALENLAHRGAFGADPRTGDGAGALLQLPHELCFARWPASTSQSPGSYGTGMAFLPTELAGGRQVTRGRRRARPRGGPASCSAGARCPSISRPRASRRGRAPPGSPSSSSPTDPARDAAGPEQKGRARARAALLRAAKARRALGGGGLLPVSFDPDLRLQGDARLLAAAALLPGPERRAPARAASPSCTRGSRPTPSRPGRSPTRTATWPTTARSTPSRATATGCGPARRFLASDRFEGDLARIFPVITPGPATRRASTRCSSCSTSPGGPFPTPC